MRPADADLMPSYLSLSDHPLIDSHTSVIHHPSFTDGDIATAPSLSVCTVGGLISVAAELTSSETWILSIIIIE